MAGGSPSGMQCLADQQDERGQALILKRSAMPVMLRAVLPARGLAQWLEFLAAP